MPRFRSGINQIRIPGVWRLSQTYRELQVRFRVRGLWRLKQVSKEVWLRLRARGLWLNQISEEGRLRFRVRGLWLKQIWEEGRLRFRVRGLWLKQVSKEVWLRLRARGLWLKQIWETVRLRLRVRGQWRLKQIWEEGRLRFRVRVLWRIQQYRREIALRWRIYLGFPLSPGGLLRCVMPISSTNTMAFLIKAAADRNAARELTAENTSKVTRLRVLMVCAHEPKMDPRISWEAGAASEHFDVTVLGFNREDGSEPQTEIEGQYGLVRLRRTDMSPSRYFWYLKDLLPIWMRIVFAVMAVLVYPLAASIEIASRLVFIGVRAKSSFVRRTGKPGNSGIFSSRLWKQERADLVRGYLRMQFAPAAELFYSHIMKMPLKPHVVHCNDLDTLLVGILAKQRFGCGVVYDAHEFYPVLDAACSWIDRTFFSVIERYLIRRADAAVTVNPMLAEVMRNAYGLPRVSSVPNVEPWIEQRAALRTKSAMATLAGDRVKFLFQGRFTKSRGIDEIITAWAQVDGDNAALFLRGPDNLWRQSAVELASRLGVLDRSVYFLDAVTEAELVPAAAEADVGIIPYLPLAINERLACPNKLSQYLHAGLMVLTSNLPYVRSVLEEASAGLWYDATALSALVASVNRITTDRELLRSCQKNALAFARISYNWQKHGGLFLDLYAAAAPGQALPELHVSDKKAFTLGRELSTSP